MNPQPTFCPNLDCASRGTAGAGNLRPHDSLKNRWRCTVCGHTFAGTKGTPFYRLKADPQTFVFVVTLLAYGCPLPAIVAAFGLDARTVAHWQKKAGQHCKALHEALGQVPQDLQQVQADEVRVRLQKRAVCWLAMALCIPTRLWLGAQLSQKRDTSLLKRLAKQVKACSLARPLLVVTDGFRAYQTAFQKVFYTAVRTGRRGHPRHLACPTFVLAQTVKWTQAGRVRGIRVCHLFGAASQIACLLPKGQVLNTAYVERLNATFRQRLCGLHRRTRCLRLSQTALLDAVYLVGTVYNFCCWHTSLRQKEEQRTPAMAAGVTPHCWTVAELLSYAIAPPPFVPPKRRGRKPKSVQKGFTV
jgi:transposase-like protein/IS1 family transposase